MDKYVETLDALMKVKKEKKKKEPTIKEKEAFRSAWLSLVADTGLVGRAEQFLYWTAKIISASSGWVMSGFQSQLPLPKRDSGLSAST